MGGVIDRPGLADFLRRRRALLRPSDVGLPEGLRRRTPGLRRDEVAQLAGISTDYYTRLEQQRGSHPSESVVAGLARALRYDLDERDHLFHLAGLTPPPRRAGGHVRPGLISLADRLTDVPVVICTDLNEVLWQNPLAIALMGDHRSYRGRHRSVVWRWFTEPEVRAGMPDEDWAHNSAAQVSDLRATYSRRAGEKDITGLVEDLLECSEEFRELWERHEVGIRHLDRKRFIHPEVGVVEINCETLLTPDSDLKLLAYFPAEGTDAREKLDLLRVIGTQDLHPSP
jgi:transcriptional regulator with XRE-family HTH domain